MEVVASVIEYARYNIFWINAVALMIYVVVRYGYQPFNYWTARGVKQYKVRYPFIGDFYDTIVQPLSTVTMKHYTAFPKEKYVGTYVFQTPVLMLRDPDLIYSILVNDYSSVSERAEAADPSKGKLKKNILNLKGSDWKSMRNHLSPTFTTGKLKNMYSQMLDCSESLLKVMKNMEDGAPFEAKNILSRLTADILTSIAFGININSINDTESELRRIGLSIFENVQSVKLLNSIRLFPKPLENLIRMFLPNSEKYGDYFENFIDSVLQYRKENDIKRPDFLQLMWELLQKEERNGKIDGNDSSDLSVFDHRSLISNAFVFFAAGFEVTAAAMSFALFELAANADVQERLYEEVSRSMQKQGGVATFEALQEMKYMDQVVSETLRKYPINPNFSRRVTKEYQLPGTDLILPVGTVINVPTYGLHHDPEYFPEPDSFNPERFSEESRGNIRKGTYLPFADGPRTCIALRFARLEIKLALAVIVNRYMISLADKMKTKQEFEPKAFLLSALGGIWLTIQPRNITKTL